jgi:hypothetical protein
MRGGAGERASPAASTVARSSPAAWSTAGSIALDDRSPLKRAALLTRASQPIDAAGRRSPAGCGVSAV